MLFVVIRGGGVYFTSFYDEINGVVCIRGILEQVIKHREARSNFKEGQCDVLATRATAAFSRAGAATNVVHPPWHPQLHHTGPLRSTLESNGLNKAAKPYETAISTKHMGTKEQHDKLKE